MKIIPFTRPDIGKDEVNAVTRILRSGWLTMGEETQKFEEEFAEYVNAKYAVAVSSCTAALYLSLKYLGVGKGDEVIVPSFTFPSTVSVIVHTGATPRFVDITKDEYIMDQVSFDKALNKKTKAVIPVHFAGVRAGVKTNLPIIEDSAHLISRNGNNNAYTSSYSFYATKNITTGEGGMITCGSYKKAKWFSEARLHGLSYEAWKRYAVGAKVRIYDVKFPGYKFNTTDINSALGRVQLKRLDSFERKRKARVRLYNKLLGLNNKGTHLYPILVKDKINFLEYMRGNGVGCSFHFKALHLEPAFRKYSVKLPVTEHVASRIVTLPLDAVISDKDVRYVVGLIKKYEKYL